MVIGIDHGFGLIKTRSESFKAGLDITERLPVIAASDYMEMDGKYYAVSGTRQPLHRSKMQDDDYFMLSLIAIAKEIQERKEEHQQFVTLAVGLPLGDYRAQEEDFRRYLMRGDRRYKFKFNGQPFDITVDDVAVFPQGYAAVYAQLGQHREEPVLHILDIGSWTTDTVTLKEGTPDGSSLHSYESGVIKAIDWIGEKIKQEFGRKYSAEQIENVLWDKHVTLPQDVKDAIRDHAAEWCIAFMGRMQESGFDTTMAPTWIVGGGAYILKNYYRDEHQSEMRDTTIIDDVRANAIGYESLCKLS